MSAASSPFCCSCSPPPLCLIHTSDPFQYPPPPFPLFPSSCPLISPPPVSPKHISRLLIDSWFTGFQCASEVNPHPPSPCCPSPISLPISHHSNLCNIHHFLLLPAPHLSRLLFSAHICFSPHLRHVSSRFASFFICLPLSLLVVLMCPLEAVLWSTQMQWEYSF